MHGLLFCKKVYEFFDQVRQAPGGVSRLRRQSSPVEKKLLEELLPISRYVQHRYRTGLQLKVRWAAGNQQYDAQLLCAGGYVEMGLVPRRQFLEVSTVMHPSEHLRRELLDTEGFTFGVGDIKRDPKTKKAISRPHVYRGHEANENMLAGIHAIIAKKNRISYPQHTVLIIQCYAERLVLETDWEYVIGKLRGANVPHRFAELFLIEAAHNYTASVYPPRKG